jgi:hypothetical protein
MRWRNGAKSPVVLMIDDLTNAWHDRGGGTTWEEGGDWGGGLGDPRGALAFLEAQLLASFPEARTTFFVVAGPISAYTHAQPFSYSQPLDATPQSANFFRSLTADERFELAYHGFNHGSPGERTESFLQEWQGFASTETAVEQTKKGLEIFRRATGTIPTGGKYGGWDYNRFAEPAVDACGFLWWCRDWMPRDTTGRIDESYYEPQFFGRSSVVALPSTVHGYFWDKRQIDALLRAEQIISIEEHIAPVRPDGLVQTPNIVDDIAELRALYGHLRAKPVWHATCSEIATYVIAREQTCVHDVTLDGFRIRYTGRPERPALTLRIDCSAICDTRKPHVTLVAPDGSQIDSAAFSFDTHRFHHLVTIPVMDGDYLVRASA